MGAKQKIPCGFAPLRLCVENFPAEYAPDGAMFLAHRMGEDGRRPGEGFASDCFAMSEG